ncbi:MAG: DUF2520 domain-containing protein [Chloroherpetonaceae bacterium]|nr:DUF2520 domain-containing protein [Chloroherpetonaceae bacterium]
MITHIKVQDYRIALVGTGALGSQLALVLHQLGFSIDCLINRTLDDALELSRKIKTKVISDQVEDIPKAINLLLIAVQDSKIPEVVKQYAEHNHNLKHLTVVHFSGALTTDVLLPLGRRGALTLSMHPYQTFTKKILPNYPEKFKCYYGLQSDEEEGIEFGKFLAHQFGGKILILPKEAKTLYHISSVMLSNYMVTLTSVASELFAALGTPQREAFKVFEPIMRSMLDNLRDSERIWDALSGPIERGDVATVKRHLAELSEQMPHLISVYAAMAMETVRVAVQKGSISQDEAGIMLDDLENYLRRESEFEE